VFCLPLPNLIRLPLNLLGIVTALWAKMLTNIELPSSAEIGPGLYIPHTGYLIVSSRARIGSHCTIAHGVTIGHGGGGTHDVHDAPRIGDRVYIGPSATIIGPVRIGNDVLVGAAAVVTRSVPSGGVVVGNPARLISRRGSFDLISYPDMDLDPDRAQALAALRAEESALSSKRDASLEPCAST
jgi:serine O-acetyltransferase